MRKRIAIVYLFSMFLVLTLFVLIGKAETETHDVFQTNFAQVEIAKEETTSKETIIIGGLLVAGVSSFTYGVKAFFLIKSLRKQNKTVKEKNKELNQEIAKLKQELGLEKLE